MAPAPGDSAMPEKLARALPPLPIAVAALILALRWDDLPTRWPIHWNARGAVDGWATVAPAAVFGPLALALVVALVFEVISTALVRIGPVGDPLAPIRRATALLVRLVAADVTALISLLAVTLPLGPHLPVRAVVALMLGGLAMALGIGVRALRRATEEIRAASPDALPEGYSALYYANPDDPRLWVPKLAGMGTTLNFARPAAFWLLALFLSPVAIALVAVFTLAP